MSSPLAQKLVTNTKVSFIDKLTESVLGDEGWEKINTIGWTVVLMSWIFAYYFIGAWSFMIIAVFALFVREVGISRKAMITKYYKFNYFKIRIWEDDQFNYEVKIAFSMMEVYPLIFKDNAIKARVYINTKNHTKLVEYARNKLKLKKDYLAKINEISAKIDKLQTAKEEKDATALALSHEEDKTVKLPSPSTEDPDKTVKGESPSNPPIDEEDKDEEEEDEEDDEDEQQ